MTSYVALWGIVISVFLPLVVGFVANCNWSSLAKDLTATGLSLIVGAGSVLLAGGLTFTGDAWVDAGILILASIGASKLAYRLFKEAGVTSYFLENVGNVSN
jgi:hypothetical protein